MHVGKPCDQLSLLSHVPGRRLLEMPQLAWVDAMVIVKQVLYFSRLVLAHGPYNRIVGKKNM